MSNTLTFYKHNIARQRYTLSMEELAERFLQSTLFKDYLQGRHFNLYFALLLFIASKNGLASTHDSEELVEDGENFKAFKAIVKPHTQRP